MSWIKSVCFSGIIACLMLAFLEITFTVLYFSTGSKYFESHHETIVRGGGYADVPDYKRPSFTKEIKSNVPKIAIFGGSSANSYGVPIGFAEILEFGYSEGWVVHSYAANGAPFAGFQSDIAKLVAPYYDYLLIYSGHNELWSFLYRHSAQIHRPIVLFDGSEIDGKFALAQHHFQLREIAAKLEGSPYLESILDTRIANFLRRTISHIKRFINIRRAESFNDRDPLYEGTAVLSSNQVKTMTKDFSNALMDLAESLRPDQKLIVSTVMSNDLYPPNLAVLRTEKKLGAGQEKLIKHFYSSMADGVPLTLEEVSKLGNDAHSVFLKGRNCLYSAGPSIELENSCFQILKQARNLDAYPLRVLDSINREIVGLNEKVAVIDPEGLLPMDQEQYLDHFIDFQHPSVLGHDLIAREFAKAIGWAEKKLDISKIYNACGDLQWCSVFFENPVHCLDTADEADPLNREHFRSSVNTNAGWLRRYSKKASVPYLHEVYLDRAENVLSACNF